MERKVYHHLIKIEILPKTTEISKQKEIYTLHHGKRIQYEKNQEITLKKLIRCAYQHQKKNPEYNLGNNNCQTFLDVLFCEKKEIEKEQTVCPICNHIILRRKTKDGKFKCVSCKFRYLKNKFTFKFTTKDKKTIEKLYRTKNKDVCGCDSIIKEKKCLFCSRNDPRKCKDCEKEKKWIKFVDLNDSLCTNCYWEE